MILLDTHIWVWWVHGDLKLTGELFNLLEAHESSGFGVSVMSCWEVAKLCEVGRLVLPVNVGKWIEMALAYPSVQLVPLTPQIAIESTQLPGLFHKDPADQIIVASARILGVPLVTLDANIRAYAHVDLLPTSTTKAK